MYRDPTATGKLSPRHLRVYKRLLCSFDARFKKKGRQCRPSSKYFRFQLSFRRAHRGFGNSGRILNPPAQ